MEEKPVFKKISKDQKVHTHVDTKFLINRLGKPKES
jgi:hypothetical protein